MRISWPRPVGTCRNAAGDSVVVFYLGTAGFNCCHDAGFLSDFFGDEDLRVIVINICDYTSEDSSPRASDRNQASFVANAPNS